eukprot:comp12399_c0_seq1/m.7295 comp12399_c0_seq1/g.7295  ORF comp12399_c0_seq1/g.7295 comp12399_c0_seq1/m.7295 type:complete len:444 (-) comp12399_c0_seq1:509-1840(-)
MAYDSGAIAFMLVSSALVMLMTPGLAFFYGGLVAHHTTISVMIQSFISLAVALCVWFICGYSLAFSGDVGNGFIGNFDKAFLMHAWNQPWGGENGPYPELVIFIYQGMFAVITPALITGAFTHRVRFASYLIFEVLWLIFVYVPWVHWIWGGGFLAKWGVLDFAGGIVVHATAGTAALASVLFVGNREHKVLEPHSVPFVALGTGLLWFGWHGFNAGSQLNADYGAVLAYVNTDLSAASASITWMALEWGTQRHPTFVGFLTGIIAGLATITPCAGFIMPWAAFVVGICGGAVCWLAVMLKNRVGLDDALDVWGVHGVGGCLGSALLGLFSSSSANSIAPDGLFYGGNGAFLGKQIVAIIFASVYAFVFTYFMLWGIDFIVPVKLERHHHGAVDMKEFGEMSYTGVPAPVSHEASMKDAGGQVLTDAGPVTTIPKPKEETSMA